MAIVFSVIGAEIYNLFHVKTSHATPADKPFALIGDISMNLCILKPLVILFCLLLMALK